MKLTPGVCRRCGAPYEVIQEVVEAGLQQDKDSDHGRSDMVYDYIGTTDLDNQTPTTNDFGQVRVRCENGHWSWVDADGGWAPLVRLGPGGDHTQDIQL